RDDLVTGVQTCALPILIDQQLYQFSPEDQETLEAASVAGMDFSAATVADALEQDDEEIERRCAVLARQGQFLRPAGTAEWPDGKIGRASCREREDGWAG